MFDLRSIVETEFVSRFIFFSDSLRDNRKVDEKAGLFCLEASMDMAVMTTQGAKEPRKGSDEGSSSGSGTGTAVITRTKTVTRKPGMYRVLLLNDDYTPMEFVVSVLKKYFQKSAEEATRIMLHVHHHGVGECGVFSYEVAETKVTQVMDYARKHQHPLQCIMEKK